MGSGFWTRMALIGTALFSGCHWAGMDGPISRSLATSRQFSQQGVAAIERGQWDRAETLLSQAVRACPSNPDARRSYAEALWHRGSKTEAIAQLAEAIRRNPEDAPLHARMAEMRLAMGQAEAALQDAQRAIDLDPKLAGAWAVRARLMRATGHPVEALADYHRAQGYSPADRELPLEIAELYGELDQPQRALATLQGLVESYAPGDEPQRVLHLQGLAYMALHRYDDALESLTLASARDQATPDLLFHLAEAQMAAGLSTDATTTARQALALDPKHRPSQQFLERVELAQQSGARWER